MTAPRCVGCGHWPTPDEPTIDRHGAVWHAVCWQARYPA